MKNLMCVFLVLAFVCCTVEIFASEAAADTASIALLKPVTRHRTNQPPGDINQQKQHKYSIAEDQSRQFQYRETLTFIILGILTTGSLLGYIQQSRIRKNCNQLETRQALLQAQLESVMMKEKELQRALEIKNQELASCSMNLLQKNEMIEELRNIIEQLKKTPSEQLPQQINNMRRLVDNSLHIDKDWEEFKLHFAQVHPGLFRNLKQRFPELSSNDLKVCALIKLNLNLKEAASVLGIAPESVKSARYRLRKKFNLSHEESLVDFIRSMDEENERTMLSA